MSDLERIKEIEQRIGKPLNATNFYLTARYKNNGYILNTYQRLIHLNLDACNLYDISFLAKLDSLQVLSLQGNEISNISVLEKLKKLRKLSLSHNKISELTPLKKMKNLKLLDLSFNQISVLPAWLLDFDLEIKWNYSEYNTSDSFKQR